MRSQRYRVSEGGGGGGDDDDDNNAETLNSTARSNAADLANTHREEAQFRDMSRLADYMSTLVNEQAEEQEQKEQDEEVQNNNDVDQIAAYRRRSNEREPRKQSVFNTTETPAAAHLFVNINSSPLDSKASNPTITSPNTRSIAFSEDITVLSASTAKSNKGRDGDGDDGLANAAVHNREGQLADGYDLSTVPERVPLRGLLGLNSNHMKSSAYRSLAYRSLTLWGKWSSFRILLVKLMHNTLTETIIVLLIFANCVFLALDDPRTESAAWYDAVDLVFVCLFAAESLLKITGRGFAMHPHAYLREGWNRLDFLIVVVSFLRFVPGFGNYTAIRILRVLRPLRSINGIPGLRSIVNVLFQSVKQLANVLGLAVFVFFVFGILGVQLLAGELQRRCMVPLDPPDNTTWVLYDPETFCSRDPGNGDLFGRACPERSTCRDYGNPDGGWTSFDHIGWAFLTIFECITLEGWTSTMYKVMDTWGQLGAIYFIVLVIFGAYFVLNLALAVLNENFSSLGYTDTSIIAMVRNSDGTPLLFMTFIRGPKKRRKKDPQLAGSDAAALKKKNSYTVQLRKAYQKMQRFMLKILAYPEKSKLSYFSLCILILIIVNTVVLALEHHGQPDELTDFLELANLVLTGLFVIEAVVKIIALTFRRYAADPFNVMDGFIVVTSLIDVLIDYVLEAEVSGLQVFRALRLLRVFKVLRNFSNLRVIIQVIMKSIADTGYLNLIILLYLFIGALSGMQLLGAKFDTVEDGHKPRANFDNFLFSFLSVFQVMTLDNWNGIMWNAMTAVDPLMSIYFIILVVCGPMVILNLFLAILIKGFDKHQESGFSEEAAIEQEETEQDEFASTLQNEDDEMQTMSSSLSSTILSTSFNRLQTAQPLKPITSLKPPTSVFSGTISKKHVWSTMLGDKRYVFVEPKSVQESEFQVFSGSDGIGGGGADAAALRDRSAHLMHRASASVGSDFDHGGGDGDDFDEESLAASTRVGGGDAFGGGGKSKTLLGGAFAFSVVKARNHIEDHTFTNGGTSLFMFGPENPFRIKCTQLIRWKWFDRCILLMIVVSSVLLALDNPRDDPDSTKVYVLDNLNTVFTLLFTLEMVLKVISLGMAIGHGAYLSDPFNVLDGAVVTISLLALMMSWFATETSGLSSLRVLRTFRAIRPLRFINRNRGLRMVVLTLLKAIPGIGHVALVSLLVYLVLAILGVQAFKGILYSCTDTAITARLNCTGVDPLTNETRRWVNNPQHFDNTLNSILTLFEVSTLEGWADIMYKTTDGVSYDTAPQRDHRPYVSLYFIAVIIMCSFFILNLFVGVVIFNFNKVKMGMDGLLFMTEEQRLWTETQRIMLNFRPAHNPLPLANPLSRMLHKRVYCLRFEVLIGACISANIVSLAVEHHNMTDTQVTTLQYLDFVFTIVFLVEAVLKIACIGMKYFRDRSNQFDFFLVVVGLVGSVLDILSMLSFRLTDQSVLRLFRVLRIGRMMRLVRSSKDIRVLLETLWYSLPSLGNVGGFLLLLFFVYACIGVSLFAKVKRGNWVTHNANFESFPLAMLLLLRMSTGEDWNGIMHECMVEPPNCSSEEDNCGSPAAPFYFVTFVLMASLVMINLFIAIILDNFSSTMKLEESALKMTDLSKFVHAWSLFDPDATMLMPTYRIPKLLAVLGPPLGIKQEYTRIDILKKTGEYQIPEHGGLVHFVETLVPLARRVMDVHMDFVAMRAEEESWRAEFPDLKHLPVLRYRQRRVTIDQYFSATYISAAYRRHKAREDFLKMRGGSGGSSVAADETGSATFQLKVDFVPQQQPAPESESIRTSPAILLPTKLSRFSDEFVADVVPPSLSDDPAGGTASRLSSTGAMHSRRSSPIVRLVSSNDIDEESSEWSRSGGIPVPNLRISSSVAAGGSSHPSPTPSFNPVKVETSSSGSSSDDNNNDISRSIVVVPPPTGPTEPSIVDIPESLHHAPDAPLGVSHIITTSAAHNGEPIDNSVELYWDELRDRSRAERVRPANIERAGRSSPNGPLSPHSPSSLRRHAAEKKCGNPWQRLRNGQRSRNKKRAAVAPAPSAWSAVGGDGEQPSNSNEQQQPPKELVVGVEAPSCCAADTNIQRSRSADEMV
eukprot:PhM_4_TR7750/c0_g1_i1/m.105600/K04833/SCN1A; voltage-gated sodium channel type I alpha